MVFGDKQQFAIEICVIEIIDDWIFGSLVFWFVGEIVGNPNDKTVDLKGSINWLKDFIENKKNRFELGLYEQDLEQIYLKLIRSVIYLGSDDQLAEEVYKYTFSRFHISHLGMSSFDSFNIVLIESLSGLQRCVWQQGEQPVKEAYLSKNELQKIATEVLKYFQWQYD